MMQIRICPDCEPLITRQIDGGSSMVMGLLDSKKGLFHILVSRKHPDDTVVRVKYCTAGD